MLADAGVEDQRLIDMADACKLIAAQSPTAGAEDQSTHRQPERGIQLDRLGITYELIKDQLLIDLQKAAFAIGMAKVRRQKIPRKPIFEERDELIYKEVCARTPYCEIQGILRRKYPASQKLDYLCVTISRIHQIASEYAERNRLPKPPPRQRRRS
jgi:hypothetical protein